MQLRLAALVSLLITLPAFGHRMHVEAKVVDNQVRVEAYYDDDTPAQQAKITISSGETIVAEGRTDEKGVWLCPRPAPGSYTVHAENVGHKATDQLTISDPAAKVVAGPSPPPETGNREENTRTPWQRIGLGIGLIVSVSIMSYLLRRKSSQNPPATE